MRMLGPVVVVASFACGTIATAQTAKTEAAATVLAATREALGGEKKLASVKTLVATGRTRQIRGENLVPIEFEIAMELPDRYVRKDEIPAQESGPTTVGFNGEELIQYPEPAAPTGPGISLPVPTPERLDAARKTRLANVRQDFARLTLGLFATSFTSMPLTFSYVGKAEAPQGKADVLDVKGPGNFSARLFVNADTHLPIMISWQAPTPPQRGRPPSRGDAPTASAGQAAAPPSRGAPPASTGQAPPGPPAPPPESRIYFADYRDVGGMQFPFRLRRALGPDTVEETTFDGFKINAKIDPKKFEVRK
jgi:hypothetical protein